MKYPVPDKTSSLLDPKIAIPTQNPGLFFDRYLSFSSNWEIPSNVKKGNFSRVLDATKKIDRELLKANFLRWRTAIEDQKGILFSNRTQGRFVTGLGRKNILEVGFTFNKYGFPILPGSSVKGIARSRALLDIADHLEINSLSELEKRLVDCLNEDLEKQLKPIDPDLKTFGAAQLFRRIFGLQDQKGTVHFLDAIPDPGRLPNIVLDVMTPHFSAYYQNSNQAPTDNLSPTPINFLAIEDTIFWFGMVYDDPQSLKKEACLDVACTWLKAGLRALGAGAKTNAGYGRFIDCG